MPVDNGNNLIMSPPRIFLDTNHLINITRIRRGLPLGAGQSSESYAFIDQCFAQHYGIVFSEWAPLDWVDGNATESSVCEIAQVIDSARLKYLLEVDQSIYLREVLNECKCSYPELMVPQFECLHVMSNGGSYEPAMLKIAHLIPEHFPDCVQESWGALIEDGMTHMPIISVKEHVKNALLWKRDNLEKYRERVAGFKDSLSEDIEHQAEYFADPLRFHTTWLKRFLKVDKIIMACNQALSENDVTAILANLNLTRCPSVQLYFKVREHRMRAGHPPTDNDVDDWAILPATVYADIVLIDRSFRDLVLRADRGLESKVFFRANDAVSKLRI